MLYFSYAKQDRKKNVLFAPKDFPEAEVARIKEAVGELTVEPLTWKPKGDVVLVLAR